ncbi:MAG: ROK family transcriptional regulator [Rikenellaceae bacterium]|nr:ROK family transcriptional regulator [Rikenellaceae bacterium]
MKTIAYYLNDFSKSPLRGVQQKSLLYKRRIITFLAVNEACTLSDLAAELNTSIPTVTKFVFELIADKIIVDYGKIETSGGRRPNLYGLAQSSICFVGVDVCHHHISFVVTDLRNNVIDIKSHEPFELVNTEVCLDELCTRISAYIEGADVDPTKILGIGVSLSGRINSNTGYSYHYFNFTGRPLSEIIERRTGFRVLVENDTRAGCYAEYANLEAEGASNMIYFYISYGLAAGIIVDGKLYYGKSGFAGEFGHIPLFENDIICQCGKKGCLETEVSGIALERIMEERIRAGYTTSLSKRCEQGEPIYAKDIIEAAKNDDVLSIELIEEMGEKAGRAIAMLLNIFNPELFIVGGLLAGAGDYLMLPIKSAVNKYAANLVHSDTRFGLSTLDDNARLFGVTMLIREKILGL